MRDILDQLELIVESTGLAGRAPGAVFKNAEGDQIVFNELKFFPDNGGKLTPEQMDDIEAQLEPMNVQWLNNRGSKSGGIAVANFTDSSGNDMNVGQYFQQINPNLKKNHIPNTIYGYSLDTKSSNKSKELLKPQDLLTNKVDLTIPMIMKQLAESLGTDNPLYAVAHSIAMGQPLPIKFPAPEGISFTGFRDYFCEILQPMAIQMGQYTGNAGEAAEKFLNGTFKGTLITFDESVTAGLSDSIISTKDGKSILISTKGGAGATASAKNLLDKIDQLEETADGRKFLKNYTEVVDILKNIVKYGQGGSPLYLGIKYGIINEKEAEQIKDLRGQQLVNLKNIEATPLTPRLKKYAIGRNTKTPDATDLYYHIMAVVAEKAADAVNEKTNFSKAAADILNNGALVQVYTKAKESKTEWTLDEFKTVYPSDNIKGVYLNSSKTYYSSDIKGNFTFKIDKGEGVPKDDKQEEKPAKSVSTKNLAKAAKDIVEPKRKQRPKSDRGEPDVGRAKRPKR